MYKGPIQICFSSGSIAQRPVVIIGCGSTRGPDNNVFINLGSTAQWPDTQEIYLSSKVYNRA